MPGVKGMKCTNGAKKGGARVGSGRKSHLITQDERLAAKAAAERYSEACGGRSVWDCLMDVIYGSDCMVCDGTGKVSPNDACDFCKGSGVMGVSPSDRIKAIKVYADTQVAKLSHSIQEKVETKVIRRPERMPDPAHEGEGVH